MHLLGHHPAMFVHDQVVLRQASFRHFHLPLVDTPADCHQLPPRDGRILHRLEAPLALPALLCQCLLVDVGVGACACCRVGVGACCLCQCLFVDVGVGACACCRVGVGACCLPLLADALLHLGLPARLDLVLLIDALLHLGFLARLDLLLGVCLGLGLAPALALGP